MDTKSAQLQIRVSAREKTAIQRLARQAGMDMSTFVLARVLSSPSARFAACCDDLQRSGPASFALAELNSFLAGLSAPELRDAVSLAPVGALSPYMANYVAALVEYACHLQELEVPGWVARIEPLTEPVFGSSLQSLRLYLLTHSPPTFRARNIFIDSSLGDRV